MTELSPDTQKILDCLRQVAADTLERKRRLGHYAVLWRDGRPVLIGDDAPSDYTQERRAWVDQTSLEDVLAAMRQHQGDDTAQYDEVIE
jgi:2-polyprenyl-6-methoxyphenol hydroxylase-like FAD-dependent oxidoreductase